MLDQLTYQPFSTIVKHTTAVRPVNGHGRRAFKHLSKSQRAALAVAVVRGEASLQPTLDVVSRALDVSRTYVETAAKLSSEQLRQLRQGKVTLADLKPVAPGPVKPAITPDDIAGWWWSASEADRAAVVGTIWHYVDVGRAVEKPRLTETLKCRRANATALSFPNQEITHVHITLEPQLQSLYRRMPRRTVSNLAGPRAPLPRLA
jgi:hypothetical protein